VSTFDDPESSEKPSNSRFILVLAIAEEISTMMCASNEQHWPHGTDMAYYF